MPGHYHAYFDKDRCPPHQIETYATRREARAAVAGVARGFRRRGFLVTGSSSSTYHLGNGLRLYWLPCLDPDCTLGKGE